MHFVENSACLGSDGNNLLAIRARQAEKGERWIVVPEILNAARPVGAVTATGIRCEVNLVDTTQLRMCIILLFPVPIAH